MTKLYLSVGSNFGSKKDNVARALDWLRNTLVNTRCSSIYETPEIHGYGPSYFNAVIEGLTDMPLSKFNYTLKDYEIKSGRTPEAKERKEVIIDLDIVMWDSEVIRPEDFKRQFFQKGYQEIK